MLTLLFVAGLLLRLNRDPTTLSATLSLSYYAQTPPIMRPTKITAIVWHSITHLNPPSTILHHSYYIIPNSSMTLPNPSDKWPSW